MGTDPIPPIPRQTRRWPSRGPARTEPRGAPGRPSCARVVLLAGPSGSGKSTLARASGLPVVNLDDFYKSGTDPSCPKHPTLGIVDWDHPESWDGAAALDALLQLCRTGRAEVPVYDIAADSPSGTRVVQVGPGPFIAEGVFASELYRPCQEHGILLDAIVVHRDRWKNFARRAARDLKDRRKPPVTILKRGVELFSAEDEVVARALRAGFRSLGAAQTRQALTALREPRAR